MSKLVPRQPYRSHVKAAMATRVANEPFLSMWSVLAFAVLAPIAVCHLMELIR